MVQMGADVKVRAAAALVDLDKTMASHGKLAGVHILEVLGGTELAGLGEGVAADVAVLDELLLQGVGQVNKGGASVGKLGMTTGTLWGKFDSAKEREARPTEVVAGISMEKLVALARS